MVAKQAEYDVVWPLGRMSFEELPASRRSADLKNKRVAFLWDYAFFGDAMFAAVQQELAQRYPGIQFIPFDAFGNTHGHNEREVIAALQERLREHRVDIAVSGIGA